MYWGVFGASSAVFSGSFSVLVFWGVDGVDCGSKMGAIWWLARAKRASREQASGGPSSGRRRNECAKDADVRWIAAN